MSTRSRIERLEQAIGRDDQEETIIVVDWSSEQREPEPGEIIIEWDQVISDEEKP